MKPQEFLQVFVEGNYRDFIETNRTEEDLIRRGFNTTVAASHLADHFYNYNKKHNLGKTARFIKIADYLKYLSRKSSYFNDIRSLADAYKHLYQKNPDAAHVTIASAGALTVEILKPSMLIEMNYQKKEVIYTRTKTGEKIKLKVALDDVIAMWKKEIF